MEIKIFKKNVLKLVSGFFLLVSPLVLIANDDKKNIAILYPSSSIKTTALYKEIITGIATNTDQFTKTEIKITPSNHSELKHKLRINSFSSIITLGNEALEFALSLRLTTPIITVGVLLNEKNRALKGVSLSLDEDSLKKKLRLYLPKLKTVHIVDKGNNVIFFSSNNKTSFFNRKKTTDTNKTIKHLWSVINTANPKTEAVWINGSIDPEFVYKLSERAWERNIILLSHNINHLDQGITFVFFPNFKGMGEKSGQLLKQLKSNKQLEPLTTIYQGINIRTAKHLGIDTRLSEKEFKVIVK